MRRKLSPSPIARGGAVRPLRPASIASWLPTAASIALVIAGCSTPTTDTIAADPISIKRAHPPPPAPSASASIPAIDPEPMALSGLVAPVIPSPVPSASTKE